MDHNLTEHHETDKRAALPNVPMRCSPVRIEGTRRRKYLDELPAKLRTDQVAHDLRLAKRELAVLPASVPALVVAHKWLIGALEFEGDTGAHAFVAFAESVLGRPVRVARYTYTTCSYERGHDGPIYEWVGLGSGGWRGGEDASALAWHVPYALVSLYDPISGADQDLARKVPFAAYELAALRAEYERRSQTVLHIHMGDVSIGPDERVVERVNGRPENGSLRPAAAPGEDAQSLARMVVHAHGSKSVAASACGVSRALFRMWFDGTRQPDDRQLARLRASAGLDADSEPTTVTAPTITALDATTVDAWASCELKHAADMRALLAELHAAAPERRAVLLRKVRERDIVAPARPQTQTDAKTQRWADRDGRLKRLLLAKVRELGIREQEDIHERLNAWGLAGLLRFKGFDPEALAFAA